MPQPLYTLVDEAFGYREVTHPNGRIEHRIVGVQRWTGFSRDRQAFVISVNGTVSGKRVTSAYQARRDFADASAQLADCAIAGTQARKLLKEHHGLGTLHCPEEDCGADLPIGALWCVRCGLPQGRPATANERWATAHRPAIVFHMPARTTAT